MDVNNVNASVKVTACDLLISQVVRTSADDALGGTFYLEMNDDRTPDLPFDVSADEMEFALEEFAGIYNVAVSRQGPFGVANSYEWTIVFQSYDQYPKALYAEGLLLQGTNAAITVENDYCPYTHLSGDLIRSAAGRFGEVFLATLSGQSDIKATATYMADGVYELTYMTPRLGTYNLTIAKANKGGLVGRYFNNRWMFGNPTMTRIDPVIDFWWSSDDSITETGKDYITVRWTGYVLPAFSEVYNFIITVNDGARLWINDELLMDYYENDLGNLDDATVFVASTNTSLTAGQLATIKIEYRENSGVAAFSLAWSSQSQPHEIIPSYRFPISRWNC